MTHLEIGGGTLFVPGPGQINLDIHHASSPEFSRPVEQGIPLPDCSVHTVRASHVLEHISAGQPRLDTFNEIYRVLVPGGTFEIIVPCVGSTDHAGTGAPIYAGWQAWADPTHVSYWFYPESFWYFTGKFAANASYGLSLWNEISMELRDTWEARIVLGKP